MKGTRKNELTLLSKDPHTLYAYWRIADYKKRMTEEFFQCKWDALQKYLCIYDVTLVEFNGDNANEKWLLPVQNDADNWFVTGVKEHSNYCVDYGVTTESGSFFSLLRSNVVRNALSDEQNAEHNLHDRGHEEPSPWKERFNGYSLSHEGKNII